MGDKPGVLIVCYSYPPVLGGSEVEAQRVAAGLIRQGVRVRVICAGGPPMPPVSEWTDPEGVPVSILTRRASGRVKDIAFAIRVAWTMFARRGTYDIVYFLMQGLHVATGLPVAGLLGKAVLMKISGDGIVTSMSGTPTGRFELNWLRRRKIPLMLLNESMMREAERVGFTRDQLTWMPNPVETGDFRPSTPQERAAWREAHGLSPDAGVLIYTGRLSPEKGIAELMEGFRNGTRNHPDAAMVLVGDGPMRAELEALGAQLGSRYIFVGRVAQKEIPKWLGAADIFGLTSPNEGFSCSLLEAMSTGLPSVVSSIEANAQLVTDGIHGVAVPYTDTARIGAAIDFLLSDVVARKRMGVAARDRVVRNYSTDVIVGLYEKLFARVLGG